MKELKINLENCFGIAKLEHEFDFKNSKTQLIYAKNGSMKTSFAKTFERLQNGKIPEDSLYGLPSLCTIEKDSQNIQANEIYVINSFDNDLSAEDAISSLLVDKKNKKRYDELNKDIIKSKSLILVKLNKLSGVKKDRIESVLLDIFSEKSLISLLKKDFSKDSIKNYLGIKYSMIFEDKDVLSLLKNPTLSASLETYVTEYNKLISESNLYKKLSFNPSKADTVLSALSKENFFDAEHKIHLSGDSHSITEEEFSKRLEKENKDIMEDDKLKKIQESITKKVSIKKFQDLLEENPGILKELSPTHLDNFKKILWSTYLNEISDEINIFLEKYDEVQKELKEIEDIAKTQEKEWYEVVEIFKERFSPKFEVEIKNKKSAILGENNANIVFKFPIKDGVEPIHTKSELSGLNILSMGEKRALYILYILFEIESRKKEIEENPEKEILFIIDDIADSFDYKNKYAIVEYLKEMSEEENFYLIILSHNFDFFRTISSRLNTRRDNKFHTRIDDKDDVYIEKEHYQGNPFDTWKEVLKAREYRHIKYDTLDAKKHILALIPFVRNLIEYGVDKKINSFEEIEKDFLLLTNLLHLKDDTGNILILHLKEIFNKYIGTDDFDSSLNNSDSVYKLMLSIADNHISDTDYKLENKIILAIAIRLNAEKHMKNEIKSFSEEIKWYEGRGRNREKKTGAGARFLEYIKETGNQTANLFNGYIQHGDLEKIKILKSVNIMTPENIHLNSFMYEPLLDMDIVGLKNLYEKVCNL